LIRERNKVFLFYYLPMSFNGATRFLILGGFLGAGKTTLAVNLAKALKEDYDKSVAIITNDQGDVLVDTEYTKDSGFDVQEVLGGCFCAHFDEFVHSARTLVSMGKPDIIIAEPIGTSTNILASVVAPLKSLYPDEFDVAPLCVVVDCPRALRYIDGGEDEDLIPLHQMREAEILILSKTDCVIHEEVGIIKNMIKKIVPDTEIIETSSLDLHNLPTIIDLVLSERISEKIPIREDNKRFAFEKAKLGWYASTYRVSSEMPVDMYSMITETIKAIAKEYDPSSIAHVKMVLSSEKAAAKMSLVQNSMQVDGIYGSRYFENDGKMVLNARIQSPPVKLETIMREVVKEMAERHGLKIDMESESCFSPRPESPSHYLFE